MGFINELQQLIESRYALIFVETLEEDYVFSQISAVGQELKRPIYHWSVVDGLRLGDNANMYYRTNVPETCMQTIEYLVHNTPLDSSLFILKDFHRYLENDVVLRQFKDLLTYFSHTAHTFIILGPEYVLPKDVEPFATRIVGGYPDIDEIKTLLLQMWDEFKRYKHTPNIELSPDDVNRLLQMLKGLSIRQIRNIIHEIVMNDNVLDIKDMAKVAEYKKAIFDQEGILEFCKPEPVENMAGFDNLKAWLYERKIGMTENIPNLPPPKGVLLMGVQGCGKSLAVKTIASIFGLPLYRLDIPKLYSQYIGQTEENLRKALSIIDKLSPLCLWIDEIEKSVSVSNSQADGGLSQRVLGTLLTWMQERKSKCFIAATANNVHQIPPEFLRKGRFDELFFVDLPNKEERRCIFGVHLKRRGLTPANFDLDELASCTNGFSGAEIEQAIIAAPI